MNFPCGDLGAGYQESGFPRGARVANVIAIFRRELQGTFGHPLAYVVLTAFLALVSDRKSVV